MDGEKPIIGTSKALLIDRLEILSSKLGGKIGNNYGEHFENFAFEMHDYYWGDCICGYQELEDEWENNNDHRVNCYQEEYNKLSSLTEELFLSNPDIKQLCDKHNIPFNKGVGGAVHCTCDYEKRWNTFSSLYCHSYDCPIVLPNFRSDDFEVRWYKYIGRGMTTNRVVDEVEINKIFDYCEESLWIN